MKNILMVLLALGISQTSFAADECGKIESSTKLSGRLAALIFVGQNNLGGEIEVDNGGSNGKTAGSVEHIGEGSVRMYRSTLVDFQAHQKTVTYSVELQDKNMNLKKVVRNLIQSSALEMDGRDISEMNRCFDLLFANQK